MSILTALAICSLGALGLRITSTEPIPVVQEEVRKANDRAGVTPEAALLTIREVAVDGRISVRKLSADDLLRELETRVYHLRKIEPPNFQPNDSAASLKEWELIVVIDALLTRDIAGRKLAKLEFDPQTRCFVVRDTALVLDRIDELIGAIDIGDDSGSAVLKKLLREREEEEAARLGLPASGADRNRRERAHLKLGRLPDLLKNVHDALEASLHQGQPQREALRGPLLDLRDEISFIWDVRPEGWNERRDLDRLWADLASGDANVAHCALWRFCAQEKSAEFLRGHLTVMKEEKRFKELLEQLSDDSPESRDVAEKQLSVAGFVALLHGTVESISDSEARIRIKRILESWEAGKVPGARQRIRAIQALKRIPTEDARGALRDLAENSPIERERCETRAALQMLKP